MQSQLNFLLSPHSQQEFYRTHYQNRAVHIPGDETRFNHLFGWEALNRVINSTTGVHPHLKMSLNGKQFKPRDALETQTAAQKGATLIIENIDWYDPKLAVFLSQLTEETATDNRFNLYLSHPNNQGYKNHYDPQDFFILQITGHKEWWIFPETSPSVLFEQKIHDQTPPPEDSVYLHTTLAPGDVLYVPRGHWHYALAREAPSMHLTLAMFVQTGIDVARWLADELTGTEVFRKALFSSLTDLKSDNEAPKRLEFGKLQQALRDAVMSPSLFDRYIQYYVARSRDRTPFQFPAHIIPQDVETCDDSQIFHRRSQIHHICIDPKDQRIVRLTSSSRTLTFDARLEPLLRFVFSSQQFTKRQLVGVSSNEPWENIYKMLLTPLLQEGFITWA